MPANLWILIGLSSLSILCGGGWLWFVQIAMKTEGGGTFGSLLFIPIAPIQLALLIMLTRSISARLSLHHLASVALAMPFLLWAGLVMLEFTGYRSARIPETLSFTIGFLGPAIGLIVYGALLLSTIWETDFQKLILSSGAFTVGSVVIGVVALLFFFDSSFIFARARLALMTTSGRERVCLIQAGYARQMEFDLRSLWKRYCQGKDDEKFGVNQDETELHVISNLMKPDAHALLVTNLRARFSDIHSHEKTDETFVNPSVHRYVFQIPIANKSNQDLLFVLNSIFGWRGTR